MPTKPLYLGTAGWSIPSRFSEELPTTGSHLERYARGFGCCEINSSFYRPHRIETWAKWAAAVPEDFRFSVKAPKAITHESKLACTAALLQPFLAQATTLAAKLGPLLFQLPPKLAFDAEIAERFLTLLRDLHTGPIVFEPRHPSWFTDEADDIFQRFEIARAAADPSKIPEAATTGGWNSLIYYRLHGSPRVYYSSYGDEFLEPLAESLGQHDAAERWCIFDNTASGAALGDARRLQHLAEKTAKALARPA